MREQTEVPPLSPPEKKFSSFLGPPSYASDTQYETLTLGNVQSENPRIVMASEQHIGLEGMAMKVRHNLDPAGMLIFLH